jgi:hypothetical protein
LTKFKKVVELYGKIKMEDEMKQKKLILLMSILVAFLLNITLPIKADNQNAWKKPLGVYGGEIDDVEFSPNFAIDNTVFAGGPEGTYVSHDGGSRWNSLNFTLAEGVTSITVSSNYSTDHTLIAGTKNGIFISKDSGSNWSSFQNGAPSAYVVDVESDSSGNYFALSFDGFFIEKKPQEDSWKVVQTFQTIVPNTFTVYGNAVYIGCEMGTIYKVSLANNTVETIASNLTEGAVSSICVNGSEIVASTYDNGVFISKDEKNFVHELEGDRLSSVRISDEGTIYALEMYGGVRIKKDSSWQELPINISSTNISFALAPNFSKSNTLIISSYEYGIIKSNDLKTFSVSNNGITNVNISSISFSKQYSSNHIIYLGTMSDGLYVSKDGGNSFTNTSNMQSHQISAVTELTSGSIAVGTFGEGIWVSNDNGTSFTQAGILTTTSISFIEEASTGVVAVGTKDDGLYLSDLQFKNATKAKDLWSIDTNISALKISGNNIFVGTSGGNLYLSNDNGKTFKEFANNAFWGLSITGLAVSPNYETDGTILVGTAGGEFVSNDRGIHFTQIYDLGSTWADGCAISPNYKNDGFIVVGAWGYVYIEYKNSAGFSDIYSNISNRYVTQIALTPDFSYSKSGSIIVLTSSGGIFTLQQSSPIVIKMTIGKTGMDVNGKFVTTDVAPVIKNSRTLVPIRFVSDAFGANVDWNDKEKKVTITFGQHSILLYIGKATAYVDGHEMQIDSTNSKVVPEIINNRTYVPIRFISEGFNAKVEWNDSLKQVTITLGGE